MSIKLIKNALTATFGLAIIFTLSCSSGDDNTEGNGTSSSSSGGGDGSSSSGGRSSSSIVVVYGTPVTYEGEIYETVVIGEQTWMARNLNYAVEGSKCYNCNHVGYGRLYDWTTAMVLPSSCHPESCADSIVYPHRGICPEGWHIPSDAEWTTLTDFIGDLSAATKLKAVGFSTLMSGLHSGGILDYNTYYKAYYSDGEFTLYDVDGFWWSASESSPDYAYCRNISKFSSGVKRGSKSKGNSLSVRCLQDIDSPPVDLCAGFVEGTEREHYGHNKSQFCDSRDGKKYVYVSIGEQTWMAENLNYAANESKCNGDLDSNCDIYGRLYRWATAMAISSVYNKVYYNSTAKHKGVCPSGWHIPSDDEWTTLKDYVGSNSGTKLKATSGWTYKGNGRDTYGFSALPGEGSDGGYWWSASDILKDGDGLRAIYLYITELDELFQTAWGKSDLHSVRCLKD